MNNKDQALPPKKRAIISEEGRKNISEGLKKYFAHNPSPKKGKPMSEENKAKLAEARKKIGPVSEETRKKRSESLKGRKFSEDHIRKLSEARKGKPIPEKLRAKLIGHPVSEETRRKISESHKRRGAVSEETRRKISEGLTGREISEETRKKLSISASKQINRSRWSKHGWYKGFWCDSSYELFFVMFCLDHNISIQRNHVGYKYTYNNREHRFYPDFIVNGKLVEIKNYRSELTDIKIAAVTDEIEIIYKSDMQLYFDHFNSNYSGCPDDYLSKSPNAEKNL